MKQYMAVAPGARRSFSHTRPVFVIDDLDDLAGPRDGVVRLPVHIDWTPSSVYDLSDPTRRASMYSVILREAGNESELASLLNRHELVSMWPTIDVPAHIREFWESAHPVLKGA